MGGAGPCDCGLDLSVDPLELFGPLLVLGARRGRREIRQSNTEAFIEAEETPIRNRRRIRLTIDLKSAHSWPACGGGADRMNLNNPVTPIIMQDQANPLG